MQFYSCYELTLHKAEAQKDWHDEGAICYIQKFNL